MKNGQKRLCHFQEEVLRRRKNPLFSFPRQVPDGGCFIGLARSGSQQRKDDIGKRVVGESLMKGPSTKMWLGLAETKKGW